MGYKMFNNRTLRRSRTRSRNSSRRNKRGGGDSTRTFTAVKVGNNRGCHSGRYHSHSPHGAASKALSPHCKHKGSCKHVDVVVRETTQGSHKKEFAYTGSRVKNHSGPVHYKGSNGKKVTIHHKHVNHLKSKG